VLGSFECAQSFCRQITLATGRTIYHRNILDDDVAEAKILNSPENRTAYQSALSVVNTAVAAKRWTEEDKETFRTAFGALTNTQRMELVNILAPAINNGAVKVEVIGLLF
jgi:hypothetical protein